MKSRGVPLRAALYAALLLAMLFSAAQLYSPKAKADGVCCTYGVDCPRRTVCCQPGIDMAPCSQNQPKYCLAACPPPPPE